MFSLVGVTGFEPAASWSRTKRTTKLCHTPMSYIQFSRDFCAIGEGTEPPNAALAAEASHIPNCATPRNIYFFEFKGICAIGEGTEPPNAALAAEASHIPNCATPRSIYFF